MKQFVAICACTLALSGCEESKQCTEIGCMDRLDVVFEPALDEVGSYSIVVEAGGLAAQCQVAVGLGGLGGAGGFGGGNETDPLDSECTGSLGFRIEVLGGESLEGLRIGSETYEEVTIKVELRDELLINDTFEPNYAKQYPNGEDCEPVCGIAEHEVASK